MTNPTSNSDETRSRGSGSFRSSASVACCLISAGLIAVVAAVGCSRSDKTEVFGEVKLNGQPLADGDISFLPELGAAASQSSAAIQQGSYRLTGEWGLVPGTYEVRINAYRAPTDKSNMLPGGSLDKPPETPGIPNREQFLPKKFNTESTLEKLVVAPGKTKIKQDYDLKP
jgi:hypothetical protein